PNFKAIFKVEIVHEKEYFVISNLQIAEKDVYSKSLVTSKFKQSALSSPSSLIILITEFECLDAMENGVTLAVCAAAHHIHNTYVALDFSLKTLRFFHDYLNINCAADKIQMVAVPNFSGMLIAKPITIFAETKILHDHIWSDTQTEIEIAALVSQRIIDEVFKKFYFFISFISFFFEIATD
ncbi:endoplasmic reticulum aminopeptidase 1-like protein, partial [Dinothrombium tinctorium]